MSGIEPGIKAQYKKFFESDDWLPFVRIAEYYLRTAVELKVNDIDTEYESNRLLIRNVQKRLFIGIGCELLLKAFYLRNGFGINTPKQVKWHLYKIDQINRSDYAEDRTYSFNFLLDHLKNGPRLNDLQTIEDGFRIAKVFRNKEGHVAVFKHQFDAQNYSDIEKALRCFYREAFSKSLNIRFSMEPYEKGVFELN